MLRDILQNLQDAVGVTGDRARLVRFINQAYREYYEKTDLPGSLMEQSFEFDGGEQLITLPWYVGEVRAMRRDKTNRPITLHDRIPRYHVTPWVQPDTTFYVLGTRAIHTPLKIESQIGFNIALPQSAPFTVTIRGQTAAAAMVTETLRFAAGDTNKVTTTQFAKDNPIGIESISRHGEVTADIEVVDGAQTVICTIPNAIESPRHIVVQWNNATTGISTTDNVIEILYKKVFVPLTNDADEVVFPAIENAILWKARGYAASLSKDELAGNQALLAEQKADSLFREALGTKELDTLKVANVDPNPLEGAWRQYSSSYYSTYR